MADNLGELIKQAAEKYKDKTAFEIKRGIRYERFSFIQMYDLGLRLATFLERKGIKRSMFWFFLAAGLQE